MLVNETLTLDEIMTLFNIYFEHANRPEIVADSEAMPELKLTSLISLYESIVEEVVKEYGTNEPDEILLEHIAQRMHRTLLKSCPDDQEHSPGHNATEEQPFNDLVKSWDQSLGTKVSTVNL